MIGMAGPPLVTVLSLSALQLWSLSLHSFLRKGSQEEQKEFQCLGCGQGPYIV